MTLALGVDTGGTYTDAVLVEDERRVVASAKALTTRADLARGIAAAVRAVLEQAGVAPSAISLAALSTTLATNALVEGQGARAGLVLIGFESRDLRAQGLEAALGEDPVLVLEGGHGADGTALGSPDLERLRGWAKEQSVGGFAVAARFATRNPAHERAAETVLGEATGLPVTASHRLSARLGGPKRALTALLNARLVGLTHGLVRRAEASLSGIGIAAPLMVVRGDGALMTAEAARRAPIETILSGPAASLVGARWLSGARDALVADIGGTTTDIALLRDGRPALDPEGAEVGGFRTMVEAVAIRSHGLGGDSEVRPVLDGLDGGLALGPRRVVPIALLAEQAPDVVGPALDRQLRESLPGEGHGRFLRRIEGQQTEGLPPRDAAFLDRLGAEVWPFDRVLGTRRDLRVVERLFQRGHLEVSAVTPTDAAHVLGRMQRWDARAARSALTLMARGRTGAGTVLADGADALAQAILDALTRATGLALLETVFAEEGWSGAPGSLARHPLLAAGLAGHSDLLTLSARLAVPVVGLGASARCHYPAVARWLGAEMSLPELGGVANAIGAVVGRVAVRRTGVLTAPSEGLYRVHLASGPQDFPGIDEALSTLEAALGAEARDAALASGADGVTVSLSRETREARVEGRQVILEATVTAEASGRPRIAGEPIAPPAR